MLIYFSPGSVQQTILDNRENTNVDGDAANLVDSCPQPILMHPLHQQLLRADTETPPQSPPKTQESWRIHRRLTVEQSMLDCRAKSP